MNWDGLPEMSDMRRYSGTFLAETGRPLEMTLLVRPLGQSRIFLPRDEEQARQSLWYPHCTIGAPCLRRLGSREKSRGLLSSTSFRHCNKLPIPGNSIITAPRQSTLRKARHPPSRISSSP